MVSSILVKLNKQEKKDYKLCGHCFCSVKVYKYEVISSFGLNKAKNALIALKKNGLTNIYKCRNTHLFYSHFSETAYSEAYLSLRLEKINVDCF